MYSVIGQQALYVGGGTFRIHSTNAFVRTLKLSSCLCRASGDQEYFLHATPGAITCIAYFPFDLPSLINGSLSTHSLAADCVGGE